MSGVSRKYVKKIIDKLIEKEVDGETMEYIINKVYMREQIIKQLSKSKI